MKYILIFCLIFCLACNNEQGNFVKTQNTLSNVDSLETEHEVQNFVQKLNYPLVRYRNSNDSIINYKALEKFELKKIQDFDRGYSQDQDSIIKIFADSLKINNSFYKADFDNNGFTDLVIIGDDKSCSGESRDQKTERSCDFSVYALMNFGNDSINPVDLILSDSYNNAIIPQINVDNGRTFLEIIKPEDSYSLKIKSKLEYRYGTLVEYNNAPKEYSIEKIEYTAGGCLGKCPIFELTINENRKARLNAIAHNSLNPNLFEYKISQELKGKYQTVIDIEKFREITDLLNYLDFPTLEDWYLTSGTDHPSCNLTITYNQGKKKTIEDYGKAGTLGLQKIYKMISLLRTSQNWE